MTDDSNAFDILDLQHAMPGRVGDVGQSRLGSRSLTLADAVRRRAESTRVATRLLDFLAKAQGDRDSTDGAPVGSTAPCSPAEPTAARVTAPLDDLSFPGSIQTTTPSPTRVDGLDADAEMEARLAALDFNMGACLDAELVDARTFEARVGAALDTTHMLGRQRGYFETQLRRLVQRSA